MYIPRSFEITDVEALHELIDAHPFGLLVAIRENAPYASHIPFVLERDTGPHGTLVAHVARANPQGTLLNGSQELLAVFQGPHAYVSPRWYRPGNAVPTWNYAAVHAYGHPRIVDDPAEIRRHQERLVAAFEGADGWHMDSQPEKYLDGMMRGIVAFEMPIDRLEGKFKLSQNRPVEDRHSVADALAASEAPWDRALAEMMRRYAF